MASQDALQMYFQGPVDRGLSSIRERALLALLEQLMEEPIYDQLR